MNILRSCVIPNSADTTDERLEAAQGQPQRYAPAAGYGLKGLALGHTGSRLQNHVVTCTVNR